MINKGELYMEYENLDEATRREACEKVKQIAKAIEKIRKNIIYVLIKYLILINNVMMNIKYKCKILQMKMDSIN